MAKEKPVNKEISISQLEGWSWNSDIPIENDSSYVVYNFYQLHNKPLKDYIPEDVHFMIGQDTGLKYLIPIALELLNDNLILEAVYYPGDLLRQIMQVSTEYWKKNKDHYDRLNQIIDKNTTLLTDLKIIQEFKKIDLQD